MLSITNPNKITYVQNQYDANNMVILQTHADGGTYQFSYVLDATGNVTQTTVTDPREYVRQLSFNSDGAVTSDTKAMGRSEQQVTTYNRQQGTGLLLGRDDALESNHYVQLRRDGEIPQSGDFSWLDGGDADAPAMSYEPLFNQLIAATDPLGNTTSLAHDSNGNVLTATDPLGSTTSNFPTRQASRLR